MRKRKPILLLLCLFLFITGQAQVSRTINVTTAGTLSTLIPWNDIINTTAGVAITDLTITGNIDKSDISYLNWSSALKSIDLREATIKACIYTSTSFPDNEFPNSGFYSKQNLKSVLLPKTITGIGDLAFDNCSGLDSISFPSTVQKIGGQAFTSCSIKGKLTLPQSLTSIGYETFRICQNLTGSLIIPSSVVEIGGSAFYYCTGFNGTLSLSSSLINIGYGAFSYCSNFTGDLKIPSSVKTINGNAFMNCSGFNGTLEIPSSITTIEANTFQNCNGLKGDLLIPSSITSIKTAAFAGCSGFKGTLSIPSSVISIGASAFSGCSGLTGKLEIPSTITIIDQSTFENCKGFTGNLSIPSSVISIGARAFSGCSGFSGSLTIPNSVTSIGGSAFSGCTALNGTLLIPTSVTSISDNAFDQCIGLKRIFVYTNDPSKITLGNSVFNNIPTNTCYLYVPIGKKSLYANAPQWKNFAHIIEGYTIELTITKPDIVTNKMLDGNTIAIITKLGTLQGVAVADANNIGVTATANFENPNVGINKKLIVAYTLTGSAKDNYITPKNDTIVNAKISDFVKLSTLLSPTPGCEGSYMDLPYTLLTGTPTQYKITFNSAAQNAGIKNIAYQTLPSSVSSGVLSFYIPAYTPDGTYVGTLKMNNELNVESPDYPFTFTINVSADNIRTKFNTLVMFDNFSNRFTGYQWYKNNMEIAGATRQFYVDPTGLVGSYSLKLTTTDGSTLYSCPKVLNISPLKVQVSAFPNPVRVNESFTVQLTGLTDDQLTDTKLSIYNIQGICVYESSVLKSLNQFNLALSGAYIGHVTTDGIDSVFKIMVVK